MNDDEFEKLEEEVAAIELREYQRGMSSLAKLNRIGGEHYDVVQADCPWCGRNKTYIFNSVAGWCCEKCNYTPGADLFGGQYS